ncbi:hypothetical protein KEM52_001629, partial [Ascosphaera acerosa]
MRLVHLHIPGVIPFARAARIQDALVARFREHKRILNAAAAGGQAAGAAGGAPSTTTRQPPPPPPPPPDPAVFTFTPEPTYTTGRRDAPAGLTTAATREGRGDELPRALEPIRSLLEGHPPRASWYPTLRGGQTTYHGPGQLVIYTVMDLRALRLGPRTHIRALEQSIMGLLGRYGVPAMRTRDPGVWVPDRHVCDRSSMVTVEPADRRSDGGSCCLPATPPGARKVAAVGVHLRRFISSYGVGLNVTDAPLWYFSQITPCGL